MNMTHRFATPLAWHRTRVWQRFLHDLLLVRGRRRYTLSISPHNPLGATDPTQRRVLINPFELADPGYPTRALIRWCPLAQPDIWQQAIATALVEHEAGHIRHSGAKPSAPLLGWLWNCLEDERQERRQIAAHAPLAQTFDFLGDVVWAAQMPTQDLLAGCLVWRWEWDHAPDQRRFTPTDEDRERWEHQVRPLVEAAWQAATSDDVTALAQHILDLLALPSDAPVPDDLPRQICRCGHGHVPETGGSSVPAIDVPHTPGGIALPGHAADYPSGDGIAEGDPSAILADIEGYARSLAASLRPVVPQQHPQPHPTCGTFVLERAMVRAARPFDHRQTAAPARDVALLLLIDESGSMGDNWDEGNLIAGAIRATMLLARAAELAHITCGVWGFTDHAEPLVVQPLQQGIQPGSYRRIAGMDGFGECTWLSDVFHAAVEHLAQRTEPLKLLIVVHDGAIDPYDAERVQADVATLPKHGILLQPVLIGTDTQAMEANTKVFGHVLACPNIGDLAQRLSTWLRAIVGR
jgi:hypothetical protein